MLFLVIQLVGQKLLLLLVQARRGSVHCCAEGVSVGAVLLPWAQASFETHEGAIRSHPLYPQPSPSPAEGSHRVV